jgi:hypothetical protein
LHGQALLRIPRLHVTVGMHQSLQAAELLIKLVTIQRLLARQIQQRKVVCRKLGAQHGIFEAHNPQLKSLL